MKLEFDEKDSQRFALYQIDDFFSAKQAANPIHLAGFCSKAFRGKSSSSYVWLNS